MRLPLVASFMYRMLTQMQFNISAADLPFLILNMLRAKSPRKAPNLFQFQRFHGFGSIIEIFYASLFSCISLLQISEICMTQVVLWSCESVAILKWPMSEPSSFLLKAFMLDLLVCLWNKLHFFIFLFLHSELLPIYILCESLAISTGFIFFVYTYIMYGLDKYCTLNSWISFCSSIEKKECIFVQISCLKMILC